MTLTGPMAAPPLDPARVRALTARVRAGGARTATTWDPATGRPLAEVPQSAPEDVAEAFGRARVAQQTWARRPVAERAATLRRLHDVVLDRAEEVVDLICHESGKARKHAFEEPLHVALTARYYARVGGEHLASRRATGVVPALTRVQVHQVPKGVVGVISPWNYPFTMALCDGLPALLAGNAVVAKPDSQTMLTALLGHELLVEAGFPADLWQVVAGPGPEVGAQIVEHADHVCFTGSTRTGRLVAQRCGKRLIGCSMELGGKNPLLVLADADLDRAAEGAVRGCFSNAGQLCVSTERVLVADEVHDRFLDRFLERTRAMRLGPPHAWSTDMGSLSSRDQLETFTAHLDDAVAKGARVLAGGRARPDVGPYVVEPTVLADVTPDMVCHGQETFGPLVAVSRFRDEAEAVARANEGDYGLNASVWTRDVDRGRRVARQVRCGTVNVNEAFGASFGSIDSPMGGMRSSGLGRRQGLEGIRRFTESQTVAVQHAVRLSPMLGMSEETHARLLTGLVRVTTRLGRR